MLLPYQKKLLQDKAALRVVEKSRRIGISWASACEAVLTAAKSANNGGMDVWYMGYNQRMAEEFIQDCHFWLKAFGTLLKSSEDTRFVSHKSLQWQLKLGGFRITALSSRPENFRGKQGLAIIDEAAFHPDLDKLLQSVMALLIWGGRILIISTHQGRHNPFFELVEQAKVGVYSLHTVALKDALDQGFYQQVCRVNNEVWSMQKQLTWTKQLYGFYQNNAQEELDCIPKDSELQYFSESLISRQMKGGVVLRLSCASGFEQWPAQQRTEHFDQFYNLQVWPHLSAIRHKEVVVGLDFGRSGHSTAIAVLGVGEDCHRLLLLVELQNAPFTEQEKFLQKLIEALPGFKIAALDARGNGQYLAEKMAMHFGFNLIDQVFLTQSYYTENLPKMRLALEQQKLWLPQDALLKQDFFAFSWVAGRFSIAETGKRHGDTVVALLLALNAKKPTKPTYAYETVKRHSLFNSSWWLGLVLLYVQL